MSRPDGEAALRAHIASVEMGEDVAAMRRGFAARAGEHPPPPRVETINGIEVVRVGEGPPLIWFHGGGYVLGAPETHMVLAAHLAARGIEVILPRYPLAPERTWPAPRDAALAVMDGFPGQVALAGDSAGGHLALVGALARPGKATSLSLVSPNTDRTGLSRTRDRDGDAMNDGETDAALWAMAAPDLAPDDPEASPHLADLRGLPPVHLAAVGAEVLLDDTLILARALAAAQVPLSLHVAPGLFHMHTLWPDALAEGAAALDRIAAHVRAHAGRDGVPRGRGTASATSGAA